MINAQEKKKKTPVLNPKGIANRQRFLELFLTYETDGKKNPYFGKAYKAAMAAGYSKWHAHNILGALAKQNNAEGERVRSLEKSVRGALKGKNIDHDWFAQLVKRLGDKNDKRVVNKRLVDTGDPDSFAAKVALETVAKITGLYEPKDSDELAGLSKEQLAEIITR